MYASSHWPIYGAVYSTARTHTPKNQGREVRIVHLTIVPNEPLSEFVLPISTFLGSVRLQVLVTVGSGREKITSSRGHSENFTEPIAMTTTCSLWLFMLED